MGFKKGMYWGAATAAFQIEGAAGEDGKGPSVWDEFCTVEGAVRRGENGEIACDHYHRYAEDVKLLSEIGVNAYRFSISWPRVLPEGVGKVNPAGLDFYDRLTDELLKKGIQPFVTLFHWDYPLALQRRGGWLNPESPEWFAEFAGVVADRLSDRVTNFITWNEPQCFIGLGHLRGVHAPGLKLSWGDTVLAAHHALLAHGKAVGALRAGCKRPLSVGFAPIGETRCPVSENPADIEAARQATFRPEGLDLWNSGWWFDPVLKGEYPDCQLVKFLPAGYEKDLAEISRPVDFIGFNLYRGISVRANRDGKAEPVPLPLGTPYNQIGWQVDPKSLYWAAKFFYERYRKPLVVTENGVALADWVHLDGRVHDPARIDFLRRYLIALRRAADEGADIAGYFVWSLMDNMEWADGYEPRFGLVYVDYQNELKRIVKDSGYWYREVAAANGGNL